MELQFKVNKPLRQVYEMLSDLKVYGRYHPIITDVKHIEANKYRVFETVRMGFISYHFKYPASVHSDGLNSRVWYEASVMNLVKIKMDYKLDSLDTERTLLTEQLTIRSILPVHWYLRPLIKKCHIELFERMSVS